MTLSAAAARRTSSAFLRSPRTPVLPSRSIAFSTLSQPLLHQSKLQSALANSNSPGRFQSARPLVAHHVPKISNQIRSLSYLQRLRLDFKQAKKGIWRKNPILLPFTLFLITVASLGLAYAVYLELYHYVPKLNKFPPEVAKELRQALYYTEIDVQPKGAVKHFNLALKAAQEAGMHKFSDEVLGIRLTAADMMEKVGMVGSAIGTLEKAKKDILVFVEEGRKEAAAKKEEQEKQEKAIQELKAKRQTQRRSPTATEPKLEIGPELLETYERMQEEARLEEKLRDKAIKKAVGISLKIGELYESDHVQDSKKAELARESAVDIALKELAYREASGLPVKGSGSGDEDDAKIPYLTRGEASITLEELALSYIHTEKTELAIALNVRCLELLRQDEGSNPTCRQVVLLSKIATSMGIRSQQQFRTEDPEATRTQTIDNARQWATKALEVVDSIPESERDGACHESCVVTRHMLGEFAELQGKQQEAERWFKDALSFAESHRGQMQEDKELLALVKEGVDRNSKK